MKAQRLGTVFGIACAAALGISACGKNAATGNGATADPSYVDSAPTEEALAPDTGSGSAARDERVLFETAAVPASPLVTTTDDLQFQLAANGHQDGPITVSVTEREVAAELVSQVKPIVAIIQQMTTAGATGVTLTKTANSHVWVFDDNGIAYQFTEKKGAAGFGWNLKVKKGSVPDSAYVEVMLGRLKRDPSIATRAHGEGFFGIDFDKYNGVGGGTAKGQAFAAFRHNKVGAYHLFAINNFSIDGSTLLSNGLSYIHVIRLFANGTAPERVHLRGGGQFDVFVPTAAPTSNLENIFFRLHRFAGIGGYGHARVKNGDITAQAGASANTYRVIRECWDKTESTFARLTWECTGNTSPNDTTANSTCTIAEAVPNVASDFTGIDLAHPYAKATTDALAQYCVGGPSTAAGALIGTIDGTLKAVYATLLAEDEADATDGSSASVDGGTQAGVDAPTVAVPTSTTAIDASGN